MFYSRTENPVSHITKGDEEKYINNGFVKVEESAMCVVRYLMLLNMLYRILSNDELIKIFITRHSNDIKLYTLRFLRAPLPPRWQ